MKNRNTGKTHTKVTKKARNRKQDHTITKNMKKKYK